MKKKSLKKVEDPMKSKKNQQTCNKRGDHVINNGALKVVVRTLELVKY